MQAIENISDNHHHTKSQTPMKCLDSLTSCLHRSKTFTTTRPVAAPIPTKIPTISRSLAVSGRNSGGTHLPPEVQKYTKTNQHMPAIVAENDVTARSQTNSSLRVR